MIATLVLFLALGNVAHARGYGAYIADVQPADVFPGVERVGPVEGTPPAAAAYKGGAVAGYVFATDDIGYSGKPVRVMVGLSNDGTIVGARVVEHHEPILLVGIPEQRLFDFVAKFVGRRIVEEAADGGSKPPVDAISGATVTAMVVNDGVIRTAIKVARSRGIGGFSAPPAGAAAIPAASPKLATVPFAPADWNTLLSGGSVHRLSLTNHDVDDAFSKIGVGSPEPYAKAGEPGATFIDLYAGLASVERIGRNLLTDSDYQSMAGWLQPGQHAIVLAANGEYSFRGSGYVRGGIFDRFELVQGDRSIRFHDRDYRRLGGLREGAPTFAEIGAFKIREDAGFDPTQPWRIELLAQRPVGPIQKAFTSFSLNYQLPGELVSKPAAAASALRFTPADEEVEAEGGQLWKTVWRSRITDIAILCTSLVTLTLIFFFQDVLVRRPKLIYRLRLGYLLFTVLWIGGHAQAQLSVVNVFTFSHAFMTGFRWDFFLLEPLIFILWSATAVSLLFWGRGAYCGWLCPMGALQELVNVAAKRIGIRQFTPKFSWHERAWPVKYIAFIGLFAVSLHSVALAERCAEVEPFKTVVLLRFMREWPFVLYALAVLGAGLFVERAYCRYLCPLGAALAIPGRIRLFEWLKRRKQCGFECTKCARECMVQAIHPNGKINPNECLYCLHCQVIYSDHYACPPLAQKRLGRGKKAAEAQPAPAVAGN